MPALIPYAAGTTLAAGLLALPAVLGVRRLLWRRIQAPFDRDRLERNLVLASAIAGAAGAVVWADLAAVLAGERGEFAGLLLGLLAPVQLGAVPWVTGELLSGASLRRWLGLAAAAATSCAIGWASFALCFASRGLTLSPEIGLIQLSACVASGLCAAHAYLAVRGDPVQAF